MRQLINLDPRPGIFCRGSMAYDPALLGLRTITPDANGACPNHAPFRFDVTLRGNSNAGHDFPWKREDPRRDPAILSDLLEYLKTL
jgi:hypothetical protein